MTEQPFDGPAPTSQLSLRYGMICSVLLFIGSLYSCGSGSGSSMDQSKAAGDLEVVEKTDAYGNIERYSRRPEDYTKEGLYSKISPEGNLLETANYHRDTLHGTRVLYYENGDTQIVENYQYGAFVGPFRAYYEDGALELEGIYTANSMEGEWKRYYPGGQLMETVNFQDNNENGPFKEYHENGNLKAEGYYKDGDNEHGSLKIYNEQGELTRTMDCQHGVCRTIWEQETDDG